MKKVFVLLVANVMLPENDPSVLVFSSQKKMEKHLKVALSPAEFKEFQEEGEVTNDEDQRYFYFDSTVD